MRLPILLALTVVACAGCVPFRAYDIPAVTGSVRDGASAASIPGAQITITSLEKPNLVSAATTDANGHFHIEEVWHHIWLLPLPYDFFYPDATVSVSAAGYKRLQTTYYKLQSPKTETEFTIRLEPQQIP
ncbi:MAG TPA: carboxypeptidase-like regulatory domain-containing protein [Rhizomicrobium sp.]|nr:carboxypeptidase-like regulatory domain-containing protein [Rhizomicrobium sp.]